MEWGSTKDGFTNKAHFVKGLIVSRREEGVKNLLKLMASFMNDPKDRVKQPKKIIITYVIYIFTIIFETVQWSVLLQAPELYRPVE